LESYPRTGCIPQGFCKTRTGTCRNPYSWVWVRVFWGTDAGSSGKPQGYPCQSLQEGSAGQLLNIAFENIQFSHTRLIIVSSGDNAGYKNRERDCGDRYSASKKNGHSESLFHHSESMKCYQTAQPSSLPGYVLSQCYTESRPIVKPWISNDPKKQKRFHLFSPSYHFVLILFSKPPPCTYVRYILMMGSRYVLARSVLHFSPADLVFTSLPRQSPRASLRVSPVASSVAPPTACHPLHRCRSLSHPSDTGLGLDNLRVDLWLLGARTH